MQAPSLRRVALVAGSFTAAAAMAITCAPGAVAATNTASTASAQPGQLRLGTSAPLVTSRIIATWTPGTVGIVKKTTNPEPVLGEQSVLRVGVGASTAAAGRSVSYGCTGLLASGGSLQVGTGGASCRAVYPSSGGISLDLSSFTSALPVGVGSIGLTANGITANARYRDGVTTGIGKIDNAAVTVCLGVSLSGACVGTVVKVPLNLKGTVNEDVLTAVIASLTKSPLLTSLVAPLTSALRPVVSLRTNVQSANATTGVRTVVGLQVNLLQRTAAISNLAIATAGPYTAS